MRVTEHERNYEMSDAPGGEEAYPSAVPLEDEPERFIEGSPESDEIESEETADQSGAGESSANDADGSDGSEDNGDVDLEVNDG